MKWFLSVAILILSGIDVSAVTSAQPAPSLPKEKGIIHRSKVEPFFDDTQPPTEKITNTGDEAKGNPSPSPSKGKEIIRSSDVQGDVNDNEVSAGDQDADQVDRSAADGADVTEGTAADGVTVGDVDGTAVSDPGDENVEADVGTSGGVESEGKKPGVFRQFLAKLLSCLFGKPEQQDYDEAVDFVSKILPLLPAV
ncbi:leucine-rich repeat, putative [Babesia ovata]|uniref:Leucine-rich repeat, putative n=1 Tax=Babesia ovata TaxID=189622 RepID=A0A2H6K702_9APIC|nr:leucine-rich repeat, putative [Babesia ovata]GBE58765.1 leucine-rich repeat, putative [Babesia ovata]